jgi:hypothetical protein
MLDFHGRLEFDKRSARESGNSDGGPDVATGVTKNFHQDVGCGILQLLFDAVRCPRARQNEFRKLVGKFKDHLAKGIYLKYYGLNLADLLEARAVVQLEKQAVYREGDHGEFIAPNSILYMREKRLYVSYVRNDDNSHNWDAHTILPLCSATLFLLQSFASRPVLEEYWNNINLEDPVVGDPPQVDPAKNHSWRELIEWNAEMLAKWEVIRGRGFQGDEEQAARLVIQLLFVLLYPFDLSASGNVED